jgi:metallo-beta-lactamase family protein
MKLTFYGGAGEVTGVKYLLELETDSKKSVKILIDCGLLQGDQEAHKKNYEKFPFDAKQIDYLLITHAHIDHVGLIPKLYKEGFRGKAFMTPPTRDLAVLTLMDSCHLLEEEAREKRCEQLYKRGDIDGIMGLVETVNYNKKRKLQDELYFRFNDAGHMLGSAIIEIWASSTSSGQAKIVFSGDLGNAPSPLLRPPAKIKQADYILIESTYGGENHENKEQRKEILENVIEETFSQKGVLMMPAFAVERTQELLCELNELVENNRVPKAPIFIDSPMAVRATEIYKKYPQYFNKEAAKQIERGDDFYTASSGVEINK